MTERKKRKKWTGVKDKLHFVCSMRQKIWPEKRDGEPFGLRFAGQVIWRVLYSC